MVFCLAFAQLAGLQWHSSITITLYSGLFVWVALLAWRQRILWVRFGVIDALFGVFVLWVLASLLVRGGTEQVTWKYGSYLPFLTILPYACGRLIRMKDMQMFFKVVVLASTVMLALLVIDYWQHLASLEIYSRWPFFGHNYSLLPIAMLLAAALIIGSAFFLTGPGKSLKDLSLPQRVSLALLGLLAAALVTVAARGVLLAGVLGTICMLFVVQNWSRSRKFQFLLYLALVMSAAYLLLPKPQAQVYVDLMTLPEILKEPGHYARVRGAGNQVWDAATKAWVPNIRSSVPILGPDSCYAIDQGVNSLAIRRTLYQEAGVMFLHNPVWGVGAASFGRYSCADELGFPHSTILQSFAELGFVGGLLYCGLLIIALFSLIRQAFNDVSKTSNAVAQLTLSLYVMYLLTDQLYGNYFMAVGSYFLIGVAASMRTNPAWNEAPEPGNV